MGIPSFDTPDYSELFAEEKDLIVVEKKLYDGLLVVLFKNLELN
jgi:hypothetical protein